MHIRKLRREDKEPIRSILTETDVFKSEEINVALKLVEIVLENEGQADYEIYCCGSDAGEVLGYLCFGPTPITVGTFDLYWIAVKPSAQRQGLGKRLLGFCEEIVQTKKGRLLVAETSSQPRYSNARTFYLQSGYAELGHIKDYYDAGDDLIIFGKYFRQEMRNP